MMICMVKLKKVDKFRVEDFFGVLKSRQKTNATKLQRNWRKEFKERENKK